MKDLKIEEVYNITPIIPTTLSSQFQSFTSKIFGLPQTQLSIDGPFAVERYETTKKN